jgi:hypothetical protein
MTELYDLACTQDHQHVDSCYRRSTVKGGLAGIEVMSGTTQDPSGAFRGFVTVTATSAEGEAWVGQLDPSEIRQMALDFIGAAEAAEQDAIVFSVATSELELSSRDAARFVLAMRGRRK